MTARVRTMRIDNPDIGTGDASWASLYRVAGVAALVAAVLFLSDIVVLAFAGSPPVAANDWFSLLQNHRITGLIQLFFSDLFGLALLVPVIIALCAVLRRVNAAYSILAAVFAIGSIAGGFATNTSYSLVYLSDQYVAAATELQRAEIMTAAQSMLATATSTWSTGFLMSAFFVELALVILSVLMMRSSIFGKGIAYLGIVGHGLDLAHAVVFLLVMPLVNADSALAVGMPLLAIGGTVQLIWYPLVARKLFQLGRREQQTPAAISRA
ncbi:MAG: DUF4386 family protein [Anaerolineae bacterium]